MAKSLGVNNLQTYVISKADKTPGWSVFGILSRITQEAASGEWTDGKSLILIHYAGHCRKGENDELEFFGDDAFPKSFRYNNTINPRMNRFDEFEILGNTDIITILDSCHAGLATRGTSSAGRSAEIISAVRSEQLALGNVGKIKTNRTFTARLSDLVARKRGRGHESLSFAELILEMQGASNEARMPTYRIVMGNAPIRISLLPPTSSDMRTILKPSSSSSSAAETKPFLDDLRAVFTVHLQENVDEDSIKRLTDWLYQLNPRFGLKLTGVYKANSTVLTVEAARILWMAIAGLPGFSHIFDIVGPNRVKDFIPASTAQREKGLQVERENIPFRSREEGKTN